jgi:hypothetical protein
MRQYLHYDVTERSVLSFFCVIFVYFVTLFQYLDVCVKLNDGWCLYVCMCKGWAYSALAPQPTVVCCALVGVQ